MDSKTIIFEKVKAIISEYSPPFVEKKDKFSDFHLYGTKTAKVGASKYEGISFASVTIRAKHVTLGFFPIYTHSHLFNDIDPKLNKCLAGKNCFHLKEDDEEIYEAIVNMLEKGKDIYKQEDWV